MMKTHVPEFYNDVIFQCRELFIAKLADYGMSWITFRLTSLTDQLLIKARRIRRLEEMDGDSLVKEGVDAEYIGIVNYCVIALIKLLYSEKIPSFDDLIRANHQSINSEGIIKLYDSIIEKACVLANNKNHDYNGAWRDMRLSSITDQILAKLLRVKYIESTSRSLLVSENIDSQYYDILNYSVYALIKILYLDK